MILTPFRALAGLLGVLLLVALAILGAAVAVFSIQGGTGTLSLANLASLVGLPQLRDTLGAFLDGLPQGPTDIVAVLAGLGAVVLGLLLALATLQPARERDLTVADSPEGRLGMRRRAVRESAVALVQSARDVVGASAKVTPHRRRHGGRLKVTVRHTDRADAGAVRTQATQALEPVGRGANLNVSLRQRAAGERGRPS